MATQSGVRAGKAFIELSLDDKLSQGIRAAQASLQRFGASITSIGAKITAMGSALAAPFVLATKQFTTLGDQLDKLSKRTGFSVEALSQLKFAAEQSGTSIDSLGQALFRSTRRIGNAATDTGPAVRALKELGLSAQSLSQLTPDVQFFKVVEALDGVANQGRRSQLAFEIFGDNVRALTPLLNEGADGIRELMKQAGQLGLTVSQIDATSAANLADAINRLRQSFGALMVQIGAAGSEQLVKILDTFTEAIVKGQEWVRANRELVVTIAAVSAGVVGLGTAVTVFGVAISGLAASMSLLSAATVVFTPAGAVALGIGALVAATGNWAQAIDTVRTGVDSVRDALAGGDLKLAIQVAAKTLELAFKQAMMEIAKSMVLLLDAINVPLRVMRTTFRALGREDIVNALSFEGLLDPLFDLADIKLDGLKTDLEILEFRAKQVGEAARKAREEMSEPTEEAKPQGGLITDAIRRAADAGRAGMQWLQNQWENVTIAAGQYNEKLIAAKQLWEDTRTPVERFQVEINRLQGLFREGFIDKDLFARGIEKAKELIQGTDLSDFSTIQIDRTPLIGGQRAEQVFTSENREDKQTKLSEKQLTELRKIVQNTKPQPFAFGS